MASTDASGRNRPLSQTNLRLGLLTKIEAAQTIGFYQRAGFRGLGALGSAGRDILIGSQYNYIGFVL